MKNVRNTGLDGFKALCCLGIVLWHMTYRFSTLYNPENENFVFIEQWGAILSASFLIISAYLLYKPCDNNKFCIFRYLRKKLLRLWPEYFISITITYLLLTVVPLPGRYVDLKTYLLNVVFVNGYIGVNYVDGAHWYITTMLSAIVMIGLIRKCGLTKKWFPYVIWLALDGVFLLIKDNSYGMLQFVRKVSDSGHKNSRLT